MKKGEGAMAVGRAPSLFALAWTLDAAIIKDLKGEYTNNCWC